MDRIWKKPRTLYKVNCHTGRISQTQIYGERVEKGYGRMGWKVAAKDKEGNIIPDKFYDATIQVNNNPSRSMDGLTLYPPNSLVTFSANEALAWSKQYLAENIAKHKKEVAEIKKQQKNLEK